MRDFRHEEINMVSDRAKDLVSIATKKSISSDPKYVQVRSISGQSVARRKTVVRTEQRAVSPVPAGSPCKLILINLTLYFLSALLLIMIVPFYITYDTLLPLLSSPPPSPCWLVNSHNL